MEKGLYEIFANSWYRGGSIWLYSDPHFGDKDVAQFRKNNISDEEQVKRINSVLGQDDTLIILGDVGDRRYVKQLRGYKVLVMGNHEKGANNYRRRMLPYTYHSMEELYHGLNTGEIDYVGVNDYDTDGSIRYHGFKDTKLFDEVYSVVPGLGGFLVKADSEGRPDDAHPAAGYRSDHTFPAAD